MTKKEMKEYLKDHFRYDTMNSWNQSTSYAHNLKIHKVIPRDLLDKAFEIIEQGHVYEEINWLIREFDEEHDHTYQAGFNGRSGGYLVLYHGGKRDDGQLYSQPGKDFDQGEDFEDWTVDQLKARVKLVKQFDKLAEDIIATMIDYCKRYDVIEQVIQVDKQIKVLEEAK